MQRIGHIRRLVRYPVKSMAGCEMEKSILGWHGLVGDRRYGVRRIGEAGDFPWLCASRMPHLLLYQPTVFDQNSAELLPTHIRNPVGTLLDIRGEQLAEEIGSQVGFDVELMALKHGIFDDAVVSLIALKTAAHICNQAQISNDIRRFRANIEIESDNTSPFVEDDWVGSVVSFGESTDAPAIFVTKRDVRCKMISLDPDTAEHNPNVLKTSVRLNENNAGVYGTILRTGVLRVGNPIFLSGSAETVETSQAPAAE